MGARALATTRGTKRWMVPPALITCACFAALFAWLWSWLARGLDAARSAAVADADATWFARVLDRLVAHSALFALAEFTGALLAAVVGLFAMLWTFSLVYEFVSGPFLDEVHGRLEMRWFGRDLRAERERPGGIDARTAMRLTLLAGGASLVWITLALAVGGKLGVVVGILGPCASFIVARHVEPAYGCALAWRIGVELRTLATSLQAALISGVLLVCALPLLLVPLVGYPLFVLAAGFTTAIGLLDIPMSRRRWGLRLRLAFLLLHFPAVLAYGAVASLVFVVPIIGALALVPAASAGALWLVCKLDKQALRTR